MDVQKQSLNTAEWDYTLHAEYYKFRPNYAGRGIDRMLELSGFKSGGDFVAADIGAGTGNLTLMLLERGVKTIAVEPNAGMRHFGIDRTKQFGTEWLVGTGEKTGLANASVNLFAMGSSFNTTEREATLHEAVRTLKPQGWFACMWNHRNLEDEHQVIAENIIQRHVPNYTRGTRREDQSDLLRAAGEFHNLQYLEDSEQHLQPLENYILAWKSVKNKYWDLNTANGTKKFDEICADFRKELPQEMRLTYTTRIWMIQKR